MLSSVFGVATVSSEESHPSYVKSAMTYDYWKGTTWGLKEITATNFSIQFSLGPSNIHFLFYLQSMMVLSFLLSVKLEISLSKTRLWNAGGQWDPVLRLCHPSLVNSQSKYQKNICFLLIAFTCFAYANTQRLGWHPEPDWEWRLHKRLMNQLNQRLQIPKTHTTNDPSGLE